MKDLDLLIDKYLHGEASEHEKIKLKTIITQSR